jgi:chromate reductase
LSILAFAGSARSGSFNKRLVAIAAEGARAAGAECTLLDLRDYALPLYDGDLEADSGLPENATRLRELFVRHEGLLIACPEYNSSISPLLKNTIDWVTRSPKATPDLSAFQGKSVALMAASPGPLGGLRGLVVVRMLLANIGCLVLPGDVTIRGAMNSFDESGALVDEKQAERVRNVGATLAGHLRSP